MDETVFKTNFVAAFLAAKAAQEYDAACANGEQDRLSRQPVEDAIFLADEIWDRNKFLLKRVT
jgi:hypothetical protein